MHRPGDERPELAPFPGTGEEGGPLALPPLPPLPEAPVGELGVSFFVRGYAFQGNTVLSDAELGSATAAFANRELASGQLVSAREAVTRLYIERGYLTSGAFIADQIPRDGIVEITIVEGRLEEIRVSGTEHLSPSFVRSRLAAGTRGPLNVYALETDLRRLQEKTAIAHLSAALRPGSERGLSVLSVEVQEARRFALGSNFDNGASPGVDSYEYGPRLRASNLIGFDDTLALRYDHSRGLDELDSSYRLPVLPDDTTLELRYLTSRAEVVEGEFSKGVFDEGDFEARSSTWGGGLSRPFLRGEDHELWLGFFGERRRSKTYFDGRGFSFEEGADEGVVELSVLRLTQEWSRRRPADVVSLRSSFNLGLKIDATDDFFSWLGQAQWAHRFGRGWELVARGDVQLASNTLFSMEQYSMGGFHTVRGYRENLLVRDNALLGSLELRIPLWRDVNGRAVMQLAPFFDIGRSWDKDPRHIDASNARNSVVRDLQEVESIETLSSLGVGLRYMPRDRMLFTVYWGGKLRDVPDVDDDSLQDAGIHFQATIFVW